ncbi:Hypothetical predicted protein [Scomber scombrus]|uniref:Uncharacterized protein n=1 Tax=Scomber scombrus TaxID=13677 RepID=A0AAV1PUM8_SCOSC
MQSAVRGSPQLYIEIIVKHLLSGGPLDIHYEEKEKKAMTQFPLRFRVDMLVSSAKKSLEVADTVTKRNVLKRKWIKFAILRIKLLKFAVNNKTASPKTS